MTTETLKPCPFCGGRAALSTFKIEALTAENERLREALESVLAHRYGDWCDIARAALEKQP